MAANNSPVALIILGMHRSGTSALARVCNLLGAYLPPEILGATPANETGHWEPSGMVASNMKAFAAVDLDWDSVEPFPPTWFESAGTTDTERLAAAFLHNSFERKALFLLKDPRTCRTLPLWMRRLSHYKARPVVALIVRSPAEVAASLKARDGLRKQQSLLLWLRYNLEAELHSRDVPRVVATYDDLLDNWEAIGTEIARLGEFSWPANLHRAREEVESFLSLQHRHHDVNDDKAMARAEVIELVREAYAALKSLRDESARQSAMNKLDDLRARLAEADAILGGAISDLAMVRRESVALAAALQQKNQELLADLQAERTRLTEAIATSVADRDTHMAARLQADEAAAEAAAQMAAAHAENERMAADAAAQMVAVRAENERAAAQLAAVRAENERAAAQLAAVRAENERAAAALFAAETDVARAAAELLEERAKSEAKIASATAARTEAEHELHAAKTAKSESDANLAAEHEARARAEETERATSARLALQNRALRGVFPQAAGDAMRQARDEIRARVTKRQREGLGRLGPVAAIAGCALLSVGDLVRKPRLMLELARHPRLAATHLRERYLARRSGLFDRAFYVERHPDVTEGGADPFLHFMDHGWKERRPASAEFDVIRYLLDNPGLEPTGQNPLVHLLQGEGSPDAVALAYAEGVGTTDARIRLERGLIERSGLFDPDYYARHNAIPVGEDPLTHYCRYGWRQHCKVSADFDAPWYVAKYADVAASGQNPLLHYILHGAAEGRQSAPGPEPTKPLGGSSRVPFAPPAPALSSGSVQVSASSSPSRQGQNGQDQDPQLICLPGDRVFIGGAKTIVLSAHVAGKSLFGGERSFLDMADGLAACGFNVVITTPPGDADYIGELRRRSTFLRIFDYGWWRAGLPINDGVVNAFTKVLIEARADAIHVNTIMLREGLIAARRLGIPSIVHAREIINHDETLCKLIGGSADEIVSSVCASADVIVANSAATAEVFAKSDATHVIPNTVDFDALNIPNLVDPKAVTFALISSNVAKKGITDVVELARLCEDLVPSARFLIIGPASRDLTALQQECEGRLPRNLSFVGYQSSPREAIAKANVILNFSRFAESFGRTVLEGLAARRPAICYRWGALPELITHEESGFLVEVGDLRTAAGYVQRLVADPQLIMRLGEAGRNKSIERCSTAAYTDAMKRLYAEVFGRHPRPHQMGTVIAADDKHPRRITSIVKAARSLAQPLDPEAKPRIAYFVWHFPVPSETFVLNELRILVSEGYDVRVFCRQSPYPEFKPDFPIEWERVASPAELAKRLRETDRQIAHGHFTYPTVTDFLWPACEQAGIEFTFTAHAQDIFRYSNDEKNRIGEIVRSNACRRVFVLSRFHHNYLVERGAPAEKIVINGNGIDPTAFVDGAAPNRPARLFKKICAVHRFTAKKGLEHLIRAAKLFAPEGISVDIYGYGDLEKDYRDIIDKESVSNVRLLGAVETRDDLLDVFGRYDLFACPSVRAPDGDMDGIPTVLMEAMAAGLPVLATPIAGIPDLVQDGVTGVMCEPAPQAIAEAVRRYYSMPSERVEALIEHGRRHVEDNYDIRRLVAVLKRVWRNDLIDLVIVSKDNHDELREIIRRIYAMTSLPFHLTVCDNTSQAPVVALLDELHEQKGNLTVIHNGYNAMVGPGTNRALDVSFGDYAIYVCGKEGFALSPGWEIPFVHALDASPKTGLIGTLGHSPTYLTGADYPTGISLFSKFRNREYAARNPKRVFRHIQGGLFALRRAMYEQIGGFSQAVPHSMTDVEYSYYAESCGWTLGEAPHILALFNKTRPGIEAHIDERVRAIHPPRLGDLEWLDQIATGGAAYCNLCSWRGPSFNGVDGAEQCPSCQSLPSDRTFYRWLARSTLPHRRLSALGVNIPNPLLSVWRTHFQGPILTSRELAEQLRKKGKLENRAEGLQFAFLRDIPGDHDVSTCFKEAARLLSPGSIMAAQSDGEARGRLLSRAAAVGFTLAEEPLYRSTAVRYDWRRLLVFEKTERIARHA